tara:strand:- start:1105 stop:1527 length:423 start_codon:yes stop_codon:yes gene_type:complete
MVMSGSGTDKEEVPLDWSFQNHANELLRQGNHPRSNFRRSILDKVDMTEGNFVGSDFRRASMVEADLMKSAFDDCDFRGADLRKARLNISNFKNCSFEGADIRGIRGKYAIWQGSDWWNAKLDDDLAKVLAKKWPKPEDA